MAERERKWQGRWLQQEVVEVKELQVMEDNGVAEEMAAVEMIRSLITVEMNDGEESGSGRKKKAEMEVAGR
ncbi:hypothetical protein AMTR_s00028p00219740 [Amborella trichopoda]|uniref:Uncharacterized protein n=1 Tax=Amborella trichopoda TaxID=13333 RepID=W1PSH9_AMBTC|nr:hypothetical protein AMTR_s00028p00219740 [Amborella trichopoda]